jgi:DNA-binding beta-propeller fold protein YncE
MPTRLNALLAAVVFTALGCQAKAPSPETKAAPSPAAPVRVSGVGFATPESVLHDAAADVYLVSNINGSPLEKDDNGFVSRVSPDGAVLDLKWIDGAREGVTLSAPKGMAIAGDTLYVTDIDTLRLFDRATGAPKGEIAIEGATFLNDLAFAPAGGVYLTDSGLKAGASGFEPSGSAAVYHVHADGKVEPLLKDASLPGPNGVAFDGERVLVVTFGANELFTIEGGAKKVLASLPKGGLDGLARLPDGRWAVSSWEGQAVYAGPASGPFTEMAGGLPAPADIGIDAGRGRLLVPKFTENEVLIQPIAP